MSGLNRSTYRSAALILALTVGATGVARGAVTLTFDSYSWKQENAPNTGGQMSVGLHGGALFTVYPNTNSTGNVTGFVESQTGANTAVGYLSRITGIQTSGTRAVNLPFGADVGQSFARRGLTAGWAPNTLNGAGQVISDPGLPNKPGNDLVVFESGDAQVPDAMMVRVQYEAGGGPQWSRWYYQAPTSQGSATNSKPFAYAYDLTNLGVPAHGLVRQVQVANMTARDRIDAPGFFNGAGVPDPTPAPPAPANFWSPSGGQYGGALVLSGDGDHGRIQSPNLDLGAKGTLSFWVKLDNITKRNTVLEGPFNGGLEFQYRNNSSGQFYGTPQQSTGDFAIQHSGAAATAANWTNVQYTWDSSVKQMRLYVNGSEVTYVATSNQDVPSWTSIVDTVNQLLFLGTDPADATRALGGMLDDVAIFDDVLSLADLAKVRTHLDGATPITINTSNFNALRAYWDMDQSSGTTVAGSGGTGVSINLFDVYAALETPGHEWVAEGFVNPEAGGYYSAANPGPYPGAFGTLASFRIPFGNSTYDPDPLYLAALHDLEVIPEPATGAVCALMGVLAMPRRRAAPQYARRRMR